MQEIDFRGKVAVVTGAASGMGLKTSAELAALVVVPSLARLIRA